MAAPGRQRLPTSLQVSHRYNMITKMSSSTRAGRVVDAVAFLPGLAITIALASAAWFAGGLFPLVGGPVFGVVLGVSVSSSARRHSSMRPGLSVASGTVLRIAVIVLGAQLSLPQVVSVGAGSLPVMVGTLGVCFALAVGVGRRLGVSRDLRTLIGVGTGICGASAIAAASPTIRAKHPDIAYAISTIFLFNIAAVLTFPVFGRALHLSQHAFGLFAGTAVNDTSSVVAAANTYGAAAGHYAVVVKLTRTLMIIPTCLLLGALTRRRDFDAGSDDAGGTLMTRVMRVIRLVPWFLIGFLLAAGANTLHLISAAVHSSLQDAAVALITVALTAVGLSTDLPALRRAGAKPLLLGSVLWVAVAATSLTLQTV